MHLTPNHTALLAEIAAAKTPFMVEDARPWGADGAEVTARAGLADDLAAAGLIRNVGSHLEDDGPGAFTLYEATETGRGG